jgi:hypothetical protein
MGERRRGGAPNARGRGLIERDICRSAVVATQLDDPYRCSLSITNTLTLGSTIGNLGERRGEVGVEECLRRREVGQQQAVSGCRSSRLWGRSSWTALSHL